MQSKTIQSLVKHCISYKFHLVKTSELVSKYSRLFLTVKKYQSDYL